MSILTFDFETDDCVAAMNSYGAVFDRYPEKVVIFTGDDIPPDNLQAMYEEMGKDALVSALMDKYDSDRVFAWTEKFLL